MKIYQVNKILQDKNMQNKECNFKIVNNKKITLNDVILEMRKGFAQVNKRIDNLVKKNDLKE